MSFADFHQRNSNTLPTSASSSSSSSYREQTNNEISESIPRLLKELNLETKVKNKVHELLDKNGYFKEASKVTITKFKNCKNSTNLPDHFFDEEYEPLESVQ